MIEPHNKPLFELDPLFTRALKLMHSKSSTSLDELKKLFEESLANKKSESNKSKGDVVLNKNIEVKKREQIEKLYIDKATQELKDLSDLQVKKVNLNSSGNNNSPIKIKDHIDLNSSTDQLSSRKRNLSSDDSDTESSGNEKTSNSELDDLKMQLDISSLSCVVCKTLSQSPSNRLVECQECHSLYHQECHKPAITEDVNDPRFVWYCFKCSKNLKKIVTKPPAKKLKTSPTSSSSSSSSSSNVRNSPLPFTKSSALLSSSSTALLQQPFKRIEQPIKPITSKDPLTLSSKGGLAGLAANLATNKDLAGFKSKHFPTNELGKPLMKLSKLGPDKTPAKDTNNNSNSSSNGNSSSSSLSVVGKLAADNKISGLAQKSSAATTSKLAGSTFSSAIAASASSMTFSGSLARLNAETVAFKKASSSKTTEKR